MCWFIHGALQGDVDAEALNAVNGRHECRMAQGTRHALKTALVSDTWIYRVTDGCCDCESGIGAHDPNAEDVADMAALIEECCALDGAETLSFCRTWANERNRYEKTIRLSEASLRRLLADLEPNTLYTLNCKT